MLKYVSATLLAALMVCFLHADNWPSWRGLDGSGVSREKNLPAEWSKSKNVLWKAPLHGAGVSSPIVWNERVFLTASDGRRNDQLHVLCFHRDDGRLLWHTKFFGTAPTNLYPPGGMAVPTPVTDGKNLYALFGTGDLVCLDFEGRPRWIRSLAQEYGPFRNRWGMASSPLLVNDLLVIQVDHWGQSYLLGVDAKSGKNRWKTNRAATVNWSSPIDVKVNGSTQLVAIGSEKIIAYDARTGKELWSAGGINDQCVPSPIRCDGCVMIGSALNSMALRPDENKGTLSESNIRWLNKRARAYIPTPLCYRGLIYIAGDKGIVTCLDAKTGKRMWKERLGGQFHASPVAGDGKVYFANKEGSVYVLRAGEKFQFLARNDMGELIVASPAIADGRIYIRGEKHLFCVGK